MNNGDHVLNAALVSVGAGILLGVGPAAAGQMLPAAPLAAGGAALGEVVGFAVPVVLGALFPDVDTAFGRHRKTLHNLPVLGVFLAYPQLFANLQFVWLGVLTHYVLDIIGSRRGIALFYPLSSREFSVPGGVATSSRWATPLTVAITAIELALLAVVHYHLVPLDAAVGAVAETGLWLLLA